MARQSISLRSPDVPRYDALGRSASGLVTHLPDTEVARQLVGAPWSKVEVPGGRLVNRSTWIPGAWSASSVLVRGRTDLLVYAESYEARDQELLCLRFARCTDDWCRTHLQSARPAFSPILQWPSDIELPADFLSIGPTAAELGLGCTIPVSQGDDAASFIPVTWCFLRAGRAGLLLFADGEVPLNVGICDARAASIVRSSFPAVSLVSI